MPSPHMDTLERHWDGIEIHVLSLEDLLASKVASGRDKDLLDAKVIESMIASTQ